MVVLAAMFVLSGGCGNSSGQKNESGAMVSSDWKGNQEQADTAASIGTEDAGQVEDSGAGSVTQTADPNRKLIKNLDYTVETREFDEFVEKLNKLVNDSGGYVEYAQVSGNSYGNSGNRYAQYTLRVPVNQLEDIKDKIEALGNVTQASEQVEDVTLNYVDTESHIAALKAEQESLMAMLEKADSLEAVMAIQSQLTEVRYQLESYESKLRTYDNAVEYSTISLTVDEVECETKVADSYGARLKERISGNLYELKEGFLSFSLWLIGGIPYWILLAVLLTIIILILKARKRKRQNRIHMQEEAVGPRPMEDRAPGPAAGGNPADHTAPNPDPESTEKHE